MIEERLPLSIEPERFAKANRAFQGFVDFEQMPRLKEFLADVSGRAEVSLEFQTDKDGLTIVNLGLKAKLPLVCQRCLDPVMVDVDAKAVLTPVKSEAEAGDLPAHVEPFLMEEEYMSPITLVEENLLLEVPIVPSHEEGACTGQIADLASAEAVEVKRDNPFAALAELKETLN